MHTQTPNAMPEPTPTLLERLPALRRGLDRLERRPTAFGLVMWAFGLAKPVFLDHLVTPEPRAELGPVRELLEKNRKRYAEHLTGFLEYADQLAGIPLKGVEKASTAYWGNTWLPPLDALSLYGFLASERPAHYLEVGSGNSTKFARQAVRDLGLDTRITSIDPEPRAHIDHLCDEVVRVPLQDADLGVFAELEPGDILFIDGSHRLQMGSDVMVFFCELLPRLKPGCSSRSTTSCSRRTIRSPGAGASTRSSTSWPPCSPPRRSASTSSCRTPSSTPTRNCGRSLPRSGVGWA